jgi:hypothetical protein
MRRFLSLLSFLVCGALFAQEGVGPAVYPGPGTPASFEVSREVIDQLPPAARHTLEPMTIAAATIGTSRERLPRVGTVRELPEPIHVELSDDDLARSVGRILAGGLVTLGSNDRFLWTLAVSDPGAGALKLRLETTRTQPALYAAVFNRDGESHGPYAFEAGRPRWTNAVGGNEVFLQVSIARGSGASFDVTCVGHLDAGLFRPQTTATVPSCFIDATCAQASDFPNLDIATKAIALLLMPTTGGFFVCSGGLLNDVASDSIPYLLTANHCIANGFDIGNLEAYWNVRSTSCNGAMPALNTLARTDGAKLIVRNELSDFALLQMKAAPPAGSIFLGWQSSAAAVTPGTKLYRLSHPLIGDDLSAQMFSRSIVDGSSDFCDELPRTDFIYSTLDRGAVTGGSSGAPVMLDSLQVVGQLYGQCTENDDDCSPLNFTVDGSFATTYPQIAMYLNGPPCVRPELLAQPPDVTISRGALATLTANATGSGPFTYEWYVVLGGHASLAATGQTFTTGPQATTQYQVVVRNACGDVSSSLVTVTVTAAVESPKRRSTRH